MPNMKALRLMVKMLKFADGQSDYYRAPAQWRHTTYSISAETEHVTARTHVFVNGHMRYGSHFHRRFYKFLRGREGLQPSLMTTFNHQSVRKGGVQP